MIPPASIGGASAANIPSDLLGSIQAGVQEIHQTLTFDPIQNTLQVNGFVVAAGSPIPTPPTPAPASLWSYRVNVGSVQMASQPRSIVAFAGMVAAGNISPFGDLTGSTAMVSMGYAGTGGQVQFSAVTADVVGVASVFAPTGMGKIQMVTANAAPTAVAGPKGVSTTSLTFQLSGAGSTDPAGSPLKYQWQFLPVSGQTVGIDNTQSSAPFIAFPSNNVFAYGDYTFRLTVTNGAGLSSTDTVTVTFSSN